jgi:hypothetical protein
MRQLIGKIWTKEPNVIEEAYFTELIRCRECQKSVPMGIEVVRVKRDGKSKKGSQSQAARTVNHDRIRACRSAPGLGSERFCFAV